MSERGSIGGGVTSHVAQIETLRERVRQLEAERCADLVLPGWNLSRSERVILGVLVARPAATRESLHAALYDHRPDGGASDNAVSVFMVKLRRKVRPHGVIIHSGGRGRTGAAYWIDAETRGRIAGMSTGTVRVDHQRSMAALQRLEMALARFAESSAAFEEVRRAASMFIGSMNGKESSDGS